MSGFLKRRRRERLRAQPLPEAWLDIIEAKVPYYALLTPEEQRALQEHIQVFLAEKHFEGCDGLAVTDEMRLIVAAQACVLMLHVDVDYFPALMSILIYPEAFVVQHKHRDKSGLMSEDDEVLVGESWHVGAVILSWRDIQRDIRGFTGRNVVFHEFAHQIDQVNGAADGYPAHLDPELQQRWAEVLGREYERLTHAVEKGLPTFIDAYATKKPAEFFAVVTELFFELPRVLKAHHPELYEVFALFYHQNPAARLIPGQTTN